MERLQLLVKPRYLVDVTFFMYFVCQVGGGLFIGVSSSQEHEDVLVTEVSEAGSAYFSSVIFSLLILRSI